MVHGNCVLNSGFLWLNLIRYSCIFIPFLLLKWVNLIANFISISSLFGSYNVEICCSEFGDTLLRIWWYVVPNLEIRCSELGRYVVPNLEICCSEFGGLLLRIWRYVVPNLEICFSEFGDTLFPIRRYVVPNLEICCSEFGGMLFRIWRYAVPNLLIAVPNCCSCRL
jgi:hypothetical protein